MSIASGSKLGPYEIISPLGAGGMGEVYRAKDTRLSREVAIKVLPESMAADAEALVRFEREAKAVAALSHPNILALHDIGNENGVAYAVMELLEGETLRARLNAGMIPSRKLSDYARQIAEGLAAAHEKGIVHRDLKPENLWVTHDGRMKILDFGLAKVQTKTAEFSTENSPTRSVGTGVGVTLGTVGYMSPEQVRGEPADHRSDIFSFGAVLYEMASGKRAFKKNSAVETMSAILNEEPPELSLNTTVSSGLDRITRHCLEKKPGERFQSARDLAFDLASLSGTTGSGAPIAAGAASRRRFRLALLAALGIGLLALGAALDHSLFPAADAPHITDHQITFQQGNILSARFTPDGETVVYSAAWNGQPPELYTVRTDGGESRPLGLKAADVLSVSVKGEIAVKLHQSLNADPSLIGTLARMPLSGGTPREVLEHVAYAAWDPSGEQLAAVVIGGAGKARLEYPLGRPLYESSNFLGSLRFSPDGTQLAFIETDAGWNAVKRLGVIPGNSPERPVTVGTKGGVLGLAWGSDGASLWFSDRGLSRYDLRGRRRELLSNREMILHDQSRGRVLLEYGTVRSNMTASASGAPERPRSWLDGSVPVAIRDDGETLLFNETQFGGGAGGRVFLYRKGADRPLDLGVGQALDLSSDGAWVLIWQEWNTELTLAPVGIGETRKLTTGLASLLNAKFLPDGKGLVFTGSDARGGKRIFRMSLASGAPSPVSPEGDFDNALAISPDGRFVAINALSAARRGIYPLGEGEFRPLTGFDPSDSVLAWSSNGKSLYLLNRAEIVARLFRYDLAAGKRDLVRSFAPADPAGLIGLRAAALSPDGKSYAYAYRRAIHSDLHVVEGLR